MDRNCRAAFGEKWFVTAVIPGNRHRTAIPLIELPSLVLLSAIPCIAFERL